MSNQIPNLGAGLTLMSPKSLDVLLGLKNNISSSLNCCKVGQILSYNSANRTAQIQLLIDTILRDGTVLKNTVLNDVPVLTLQGGGMSLQLPIGAGDQCLVLFSDQNIDGWFVSGSENPPPFTRNHDLSDGFAIVGVNYQSSSSIPALSSTEARLVDSSGKTKFGIESGKLTIQNSSQNLLTILQTLITGILGMKTSNGATLIDSTGDVGAANNDLSELLY